MYVYIFLFTIHDQSVMVLFMDAEYFLYEACQVLRHGFPVSILNIVKKKCKLFYYYFFLLTYAVLGLLCYQ